VGRHAQYIYKIIKANKPPAPPLPIIELPPSSIFNTSLLLKYKGACVYEWKRGEEYLYIGRSTNLFLRLYTHNVIGKLEPIQEQDTITIYHCETEDEMIILEKKLIKRIRPKYNRQIRD